MKDETHCLEDRDDLVVALAALNGASVTRRPGLVMAMIAVSADAGHIAIVRSRFVGDYGNICLLESVEKDEATYAPTVKVVEALRTRAPRAAVWELFEEWRERGRKA